MYVASVARFDCDAAISEGPKIIFRSESGKLSKIVITIWTVMRTLWAEPPPIRTAAPSDYLRATLCKTEVVVQAHIGPRATSACPTAEEWIMTWSVTLGDRAVGKEARRCVGHGVD